jgi:arginyl-tRNA synthetase
VKKHVENIELVAETIGVSHLIIGDFLRQRQKDYEFSWANMLANDNSAYTLHYAHARLCSLIERTKHDLNLDVDVVDVDFGLLKTPTEQALVQHLACFDRAMWQSFVKYEPCIIVQYSFQLA